MLYKYDETSQKLEMLNFYDFEDLEGKEKDLENLLAANLRDIYTENGLLMPIFQERPWQEEPDLCALDKDGNLVIFELKRGRVQDDTTIQIMRYAQDFGQKTYIELNEVYKNYAGVDVELKAMHAQNFGLDTPLEDNRFNRKQSLVIVGSSTDHDLMNAVDYWRAKGVDIDFLPYRFYRVDGELLFEFFAKPYDYHLNPSDRKGIIFDTNATFDPEAYRDMFKERKVSAYGNSARFVRRFNKGDYVLYYHAGYGVIGVGQIIDSNVYENKESGEEYRRVRLLTPEVESIDDACYISPSELSEITGKSFLFGSTVKSPYLSAAEVMRVAEELNKRYDEERPSF